MQRVNLLERLAYVQVSMVGVRSLEEASKAKLSGADSILIKHEMLSQHQQQGTLQSMAEQLKYIVSGDD